MKPMTDKLENMVRKDMEDRNSKFGYDAFSYVGCKKTGIYWELEFYFRPQKSFSRRMMTYGGYPFVSRLGVLKAYMEDCLD